VQKTTTVFRLVPDLNFFSFHSGSTCSIMIGMSRQEAPLRLSFLLAATAHKVALFVGSKAAPLTSKC